MLSPGGEEFCPVCGKNWWWQSSAGAVRCKECGFLAGKNIG